LFASNLRTCLELDMNAMIVDLHSYATWSVKERIDPVLSASLGAVAREGVLHVLLLEPLPEDKVTNLRLRLQLVMLWRPQEDAVQGMMVNHMCIALDSVASVTRQKWHTLRAADLPLRKRKLERRRSQPLCAMNASPVGLLSCAISPTSVLTSPVGNVMWASVDLAVAPRAKTLKRQSVI
jgi:hypothetical protein